jgi:trimeric autotransporter adhesin
MLRARPLRAATVALPPPPAAPPISETSHQIREKSQTTIAPTPATARASQTAPAPPRPCFSTPTSTGEKTRRIWDKSHTIVRASAALLFLLAPVLLLLLTPSPAHAQAKGATCPVNGYTAAATQATGGQNLVCSSLTWAYVPYQFGASAGTCPGTSNVNLGMIQWTGSAFQGCTASGWGSLAGGGATALSALTSGTAVNTIDNTSMAQTWTWNSLTTQTAFTLSSSSLTNGNILSIQNTAAAATSTGKVLSISDATTGSGYGVYSVMSGKGNTGYAGYFTNTGSTNTGYAGYFVNTDTSTNTNYGVYGLTFGTGGGNSPGVAGENDSAGGIGVLGTGGSNVGVKGYGGFQGVLGQTPSTGAGYGVYGTITGHGNTGYAGYFVNTDTSSNTNYGVFGTIQSTSGNSVAVFGSDLATTGNGSGVEGNTNSTGSGSAGVYGHNATAAAAGAGVYGIMSGAANTGYAGYFTNTDTGADANYGVYVNNSSLGGYGIYTALTGQNNTGVAGYFVNGDTSSNANYGIVATTLSAGSSYGVYGSITGHGNTGYAGYFTNTDTSSNVNYGIYVSGASSGGYAIYATSNATGIWASGVNYGAYAQGGGTAGIYGLGYNTGAGAGVMGIENGAANTGYGGYFSNTGTGVVNYGIYATVSGASAWAGYFNGNVYVNGTITMSSDRRMKKDIEPLDTADALDEITELRPVAFTWKKTGVEDMGLIAQEVDLVYPDLVTHSGADETLALKYTSLIAPMIASIQELKKRDDELEAENATLRRDFNAYKEAHP